MAPKKIREFARILIESEGGASLRSLEAEPATMRVYERLRRQLGAPAGALGFQALASRALALAKSESPQLAAVQITATGNLRGLERDEFGAGADDQEPETGVAFIAHLLSLFLDLLGEPTTMRLIQDVRLQAEAAATRPTSGASSAAEVIRLNAGFEDLLVEVDRLRKLSSRVESLAGKHPGMGDGLRNVANNLRSTATLLDIFTIIRSKAGGPQENEALPAPNRYVN